MHCPMCKSVEWRSVERNILGVNILVQCLRCYTTYMTSNNPAWQPKEEKKQ